MAMYPPLKFIEQVERYIQLPAQRQFENLVNTRAMNFIDSYFEDNRDKFYHDYIGYRLKSDANKIINMSKYRDLCTKFYKSVGVEGRAFEDLDDFLNLAIYYNTRSEWRANKLSYIVDNKLFDTLMEMSYVKSAPTDCVTKLPSSCFYIDYNNRGSEICEGLLGSFLISSQGETDTSLLMVHLIKSKKLSRILYLTTPYYLGHNGNDTFMPPVSHINNEILCEDEVTRCIDNKKLSKFLFNFLLYLSSVNKDVEISERTRKNHSNTENKVIKNKFREVKEFEVGFTFGKTIKKGAVRVKYVDGDGVDKDKPKAKGTSKCSHYRSAHWHHYWIGKGDNKKLVTKWIEGVFVNTGKPASKNVKVHKVK